MTPGMLSHTVREAMRLWAAQKADGVPEAERMAGLERTLRAAWPQTREWKYYCTRCDDVGLEIKACPGDATCGHAGSHRPHSYGEPCWCSAGKRFRNAPASADADVTEAGTRRKTTRLGR